MTSIIPDEDTVKDNEAVLEWITKEELEPGFMLSVCSFDETSDLYGPCAMYLSHEYDDDEQCYALKLLVADKTITAYAHRVLPCESLVARDIIDAEGLYCTHNTFLDTTFNSHIVTAIVYDEICIDVLSRLPTD